MKTENLAYLSFFDYIICVFRLSYRYILIICLIFLDIVLIANIVLIKESNKKVNAYVLGAKIAKKNAKPVIIIKKSTSPKPTAKNTPTSIPSPTKAVIKTVSKTPTQTAPATGDLLTQVNNFRAGKGLAPLSAHSDVCFFANLRAQEIVTNFNHDGFSNRISSNSLPYKSYSSVAENIAMNPNSQNVVQSWINSSGHNANMSKDVPYGCVVGVGNYYVFEAWKP